MAICRGYATYAPIDIRDGNELPDVCTRCTNFGFKGGMFWGYALVKAAPMVEQSKLTGRPEALLRRPPL